MAEKMIASRGAEICAESFGQPGDPPILLMMGATASMLWWPDGFCELLAQAGRFVIRYDNRDTGRSTTYAPGRSAYTLDDLADDAVAVLDGYGVDRAHLVGMSLGGMIAQLVALKHPARVLTVTAISSSKLGDEDSDLPGIDDRFLEHFATSTALDWSDEDAVTDFMVRGWRLSAGSTRSFDEARTRDLARREFRRAINPQSMMNHATLTGGEAWQDRLGEITVPFLVIHGTEDPILPYAHGVALAQAMPGATLVTLEGAGHELHEADRDRILDAIVGQTAIRR